ncbi:MAG: hypothetical protein ACRDOA_23430, partial [Streptosporangiaceae bacterium]
RRAAWPGGPQVGLPPARPWTSAWYAAGGWSADAVQQGVHDPGGQQVRVGLGLAGADRGVEQAVVGPAGPKQVRVG